MASITDFYNRISEELPLDADRVSTSSSARTILSNKPVPQTQVGILWRVVSAVMSLFFLLCAAVQHNDPDPYLWIPVYVVPAVLCASMAWRPESTDSVVWKLVCVAHIVCCVLGAAYVFSIIVEGMAGRAMYNPLQHEEGRECAGLVVIVIWLCVCRFSPYGRPSADKWSMSGLLVLTALVGVAPLFVWSLCLFEGMSTSLAHCGYIDIPLALGAGKIMS